MTMYIMFFLHLKTSWDSYVVLGQIIQRLVYGRTNPDLHGDWIPPSCLWYKNESNFMPMKKWVFRGKSTCGLALTIYEKYDEKFGVFKKQVTVGIIRELVCVQTEGNVLSIMQKFCNIMNLMLLRVLTVQITR